jgi:hypothetical protein
MCGSEVVNNNDHFAAAMGGFAAQHHAARFWFARGRRGGGRGRPGRQAGDLQAGERIIQLRRAAGGELGFILFGHGKNVATARSEI